MKKLLLILLCVPLIGLGQDNLGYGEVSIKSSSFYKEMINFLYEFTDEKRTEIKFWTGEVDDGEKYVLYEAEIDGFMDKTFNVAVLLTEPICNSGFGNNEFSMNQNISALLSIFKSLKENKVYYWTTATTTGYNIERTGYAGVPAWFIVLLDENYKIIDMIRYTAI